MRLLRSLAALLLLVTASVPALAQATGSADSYTPSHREAVQRLMTVSRVREMMDQSSETMLASQLKQMPQLVPYAGILRDFYKEQMDWKILEPEFTRLYLEVFTEQELRELTTFYESPIGQKMLAKMPALMAKSNEVTSRRLQASMPKLMERLQAAMTAPPAARADSSRVAKP